MARKIRALRHWKQRFDPNASFIFRRRIEFGDTVYEPGDEIPQALRENSKKLNRFWDSQVIEIAEMEPEPEPEPTPKRRRKRSSAST